MLLQISNLDEIEKGCQEIQSFLEVTCSEDANEAVRRGIDLGVHLARSSKMLADAKYHQDKARKESIIKRLNVDLPASILKNLIDSDCEKENYIVNWCDRLNSGIVHQMDFLRTMISKVKAEMQSFGNNR